VAGELECALKLLDGAEPGEPAVTRLRGNLAMRRGDPDGALALLWEEAQRVESARDDAGAAQLYLEAAVVPMMTGDLDTQERVVRAALGCARRVGGALEVLAELVAAELAICHGRDAAGEAALAAVEPRLGEVDLLGAGEIVGMAAQTALWAGALVEGLVETGRTQDAAGVVAELAELPSRYGRLIAARGRVLLAGAGEIDAAAATALAGAPTRSRTWSPRRPRSPRWARSPPPPVPAPWSTPRPPGSPSPPRCPRRSTGSAASSPSAARTARSPGSCTSARRPSNGACRCSTAAWGSARGSSWCGC
jgi:hypothetical protein